MGKVSLIAIACLVLAGLSWAVHGIYYGGRLDENGIVQDRLFLPLGYLLVFAGLLLFAISLAGRVLGRKSRSN